jgi:hypothetical protein
MLRALMDLMCSLKMSVVHLHLTDWVAVRWQSTVAPELNLGSTGQPHRQYSKAEIDDLVEYGLDRAISIGECGTLRCRALQRGTGTVLRWLCCTCGGIRQASQGAWR